MIPYPISDKVTSVSTTANQAQDNSTIQKPSIIPAADQSMTAAPLNLDDQKIIEISQPSLASSNTSFSFKKFLEIIGNAKLKFQDAIKKMELLSYSATEQVHYSVSNQSLLDSLEAIDRTLTEIEAQVTTIMNQLKSTVDELNQIIAALNEIIETFNEGLGEQAEQFNHLIEAHETFIQEMQSLGITPNNEGIYEIPQDAELQQEYNAIINDYEQAISNFNNYWGERLQEIEKYNEAAAQYNAKIAEIQALLNQYLGPYVQEIPKIPLLTTVETFPLITSLHSIDEKGVSIEPLPEKINETWAPIPSIPLIDLDEAKIQKNLSNYLEEVKVTPLEQQLQLQMNVYFLQLYLQNQLKRMSSDNLLVLNPREFLTLLLPDAANYFNKKEAIIGEMHPASQKEKKHLSLNLTRFFSPQFFIDKFNASAFFKEIPSKQVHVASFLTLKTFNQALSNSLSAFLFYLTDKQFQATFPLLFGNDLIAKFSHVEFNKMKESLRTNSQNIATEQSLLAALKASLLITVGQSLDYWFQSEKFHEALWQLIPEDERLTLQEKVKRLHQDIEDRYQKNVQELLPSIRSNTDPLSTLHQDFQEIMSNMISPSVSEKRALSSQPELDALIKKLSEQIQLELRLLPQDVKNELILDQLKISEQAFSLNFLFAALTTQVLALRSPSEMVAKNFELQI